MPQQTYLGNKTSSHYTSVSSAGGWPDEAIEPSNAGVNEPLGLIDEPLPDGRIGVTLFDREMPGFEYDFYVHGPQDALQWIVHLADKRWVTPAHLSFLADAVLSQPSFNNAPPPPWFAVRLRRMVKRTLIRAHCFHAVPAALTRLLFRVLRLGAL